MLSQFEQVRENTWCAVSPDLERYFMLYVEPQGSAHQVIYAELDYNKKYSVCPVFKAEIYQTKVWANPEHLTKVLEAMKASILSTSLPSPSHLVYEFGGTYKNNPATRSAT